MFQRSNGAGGLHLRDSARISTAEPLAGRIRVPFFDEVRGFFAHANIYELRQRAVAGAEPVGGTVKTGVNHSPAGVGLHIREADGAALLVEARCPCLLPERDAA